MPALVMVKTSLGRCAHWKAEGHRTALCGGPGPFQTGGEGLPKCLCCQRREAKARAGVSEQGRKDFGAVEWAQPVSKVGMERLREYARLKQRPASTAQ